MVWLLGRDRNCHSSGAGELCITLFLVLLGWPAAPVIGRAQEPGGHQGMKHTLCGKWAFLPGGCAGSRDQIPVLILHSSEETRRRIKVTAV